MRLGLLGHRDAVRHVTATRGLGFSALGQAREREPAHRLEHAVARAGTRDLAIDIEQRGQTLRLGTDVGLDYHGYTERQAAR